MSISFPIVAIGVFAAVVFLSGWFSREIKYALVTKSGLIILVLLFGLLMLATGVLIGTTSTITFSDDGKITFSHKPLVLEINKKDKSDIVEKPSNLENITTTKAPSKPEKINEKK